MSDGGMLSVALLFRLIVIRRRVRRRPSLPGTASTRTAKLIQLTTTINPLGTKQTVIGNRGEIRTTNAQK